MTQPDSLKTDDYQIWSRGRGNDVWAMLHSAANGDLETIKALVARDSNLLDCEYEYYRPLHFAVRENRIDVVRFLLDQGADPFCGGNGLQPAWRPRNPDNHQWPLDVARERGHHEVLSLLQSKLARYDMRPEGEELASLIRARDIDAVRATLDRLPDLIHISDESGSRPIHWATMTRNLAMIDLLLSRGADINAVRPDGARPLDLTNGDYHYRGWRDVPPEAIRRHEVVMGYLLARGAEYDISTAAQLGDLERVRALVEANPSLVNQVPPSTGYYNGVPLRCAAGGGHLAVVKFLLAHGADPNRPEPVAPRGGALYDAIAGQHWEIVKLLLAHGADPSAPVESSGNCFWRAKRDNAPKEILKLMAAHGGSLGVELACHDNDLETLAAMLQVNPKLPIADHLPTDNEELTNLVLRHQPDVLKKKLFTGAKSLNRARWLINHGLDPKRPNWLEMTPLHRFAISENKEMAHLCLEFGADINAIDDEFSSTPLGWAARAGQTEMTQWLLEKGANPTLPQDKPWAKPIEWATRRGHADIVALLRP